MTMGLRDPLPDRRAIAAMCRVAGEWIWHKAPSAEYAQHVGLMLLETIAAESLFMYTRQVGKAFTLDNPAGAWGVAQTEKGSVWDGLNQIAEPRNAELRERCMAWCDRYGIDTTWLAQRGLDDMLPLLREIAQCDVLAVMFCRLHYLRRPGAIPATIEARAEVWKRQYNTIKGAGTVAEYLERNRRCGTADLWRETCA